MLNEAFANCPRLGGDLDQPDGCFNSLHLAEEWTDAAEVVMPPMLQQAGSFGCDKPVVRIRQASPRVYSLAKTIDDRSRIVLLLFR